MYRVSRPIHDEDMYLLTPEEYASLPNGTVLYDYHAEETFVKGHLSNYATISVFGDTQMTTKFLGIGWTPGMAESQGLDQEFFMFALTS